MALATTSQIDTGTGMARRNWNRVFVTGGTSFVGLHVVAALVNAGADVTGLVLPDHEEKLGALRRHVRMVYGDVWNIASLRGRSRGHGAVLHLVGSLRAHPSRGQTFHQLNLVSARNAISMAVSDGVPYFVLLSAASRPPGVSTEYLRSKREAEDYLRSSGLRWAIIRAPVLFDRAQHGGALFNMLSRIGALPLLRVFAGRHVPLPVELAARGIAQVTLQSELPPNRVLYAGDLRRLGRMTGQKKARLPSSRPSEPGPESLLDDEVPFGWQPDPPRGKE